MERLRSNSPQWEHLSTPTPVPEPKAEEAPPVQEEENVAEEKSWW